MCFNITNFFSGTETFHVVRNQVRQSESVNHASQSTAQEKFSQEVVYSEREINYQPSNQSVESSPVTASNFAVNFQESFERECVQEQDALPDTPSGSSSSKEHFSPKCGFAPPYMPRMPQRCERPTAIRMLPKGGKSRVRSSFMKYNNLFYNTVKRVNLNGLTHLSEKA